MSVGKYTHRTAGFTLIELLVTIAVVVILATVAVPGFQRLMATNRMATDYNTVLAGINYARSEAIKQRKDVTFEVTSSQPWMYAVYTDLVTDPLRVQRGRGSKTSLEEAEIVFNALGRAPNCTPCTVLMEDGTGQDSDRRFIINSSGDVRGERVDD